MIFCDCAALTSPSRYNDFVETKKGARAGPGGVYSPHAGANFQTVVFYPPPEFHGESLLSSPLVPGSPPRATTTVGDLCRTPPPPVPIVATRSTLLLI